MNALPAKAIIVPLGTRPDLLDTAADRIWQAWWREGGQPLQAVADHMQPMLDGRTVPLAFVATMDGRYAGSALVIDCDLDERADLTPWIAAVWVEPESRRQGIGQALVDTATDAIGRLGFPMAHLCATAANAPFYERFGWHRIENDVGPHRLSVLSKAALSKTALSKAAPSKTGRVG